MKLAKLAKFGKPKRARTQHQMTALHDRLWQISEELRSVSVVQNDLFIERVYDFSGPRSIYMEHLWRYRFAAERTRGRQVLDMACGSGYGSHFLATQGGAQQVTGIDIDPDAIRYARLRYPQDNLHFRQGNACAPCPGKRYEVIVSFETIEHVPYPDRLLASLAQMLSEDGVLYISSPVRRGGRLQDAPANPFHVREWTTEEFTALLGHCFHTIDAFGQNWLPRERFGPLPLRGKWRSAAMRLTGFDMGRIGMPFALHALPAPPSRWLETEPLYVILRCANARREVDAQALRALCYGEERAGIV